MKKGADAFRSIGEVAKLIGVAPHVLRYWETQFSQLRPMKRPDGRRYYRPEDVRLAAGLCEILREEGLTIRGARKMLARDRGEAVRARGAERLEGLLGAQLLAAALRAPAGAGGVAHGPEPAPAPATRDPAPEPVDLDLHPDMTDPDLADPDTLAEEDPEDMASHLPRSRHRLRRRSGAAGDETLPLFPDLDGQPAPAVWLASLQSLTGGLRGLLDGDPRLGSARPHLLALRDSIAGLY